MKHQFGVKIATSLETDDICDIWGKAHVCVIDLRRCINNGPFPIEETTLRRLANYRIAYHQMPMSLYSATARQENELYRTITEQGGTVLVVTDHPVPLARLCQQCDIPFTSTDMYIVETASDYIPVQIAPKPTPPAQFGSFGA